MLELSVFPTISHEHTNTKVRAWFLSHEQNFMQSVVGYIHFCMPDHTNMTAAFEPFWPSL
jgi:hypothetical protein